MIADPSDVVSHELLIDILLNLGLPDQARTTYAAYAEENPGDAVAWSLLGRATVDEEASTAAYRKSVTLDPGLGRGWAGIAALERADGKATEALDHYRKAVSLDPSLAEAWTAIGALLIATDRYDEAAANARAAMKAVPKDPEAYLALAELRPDEALKVLSAGAKAVPGEPRLQVALARELATVGRYDEAVTALERALKVYPGSPQATLELAMVRELKAGTLDLAGREALARARMLTREAPVAAALELEDLVAAHPDSALVFLARAHLRSEQGDTRGAEADLRRSLALSPDSVDAKAALGLLLFSTKRYPEAMTLLDQAQVSRPYDASLAISAGLAHVAVEGPRKGLLVLDDVARRFPTDTRVVMSIVGVLSQAGDAEGAYNVLKRAVSIYPEPSLVLTLAAAARDLGKNQEAAVLLRQLEAATGDPRFGRMARELEAGGR